MHLFCSGFMLSAYRAWKDGRTLDPADAESMLRLATLPRLESGS